MREGSQPDDSGEPAFHVPDCIPVFPLPNVVFFPKTYLPLHIFEPRYRQMVADAVRDGRCVGMALLREGWEENYYGNPPIHATGCVGRLVSVQPLPDGRFNILLQGLERFEIQKQYYDRSYRQARVVLKPDAGDLVLQAPLRTELLRVLRGVLKDHEDDHPWRHLLRPDVNDEVLVNTMSGSLDLTALEKQFLLEADSLLQRSRRLFDLLQFKLHEHDGVKGWG